MLQVNGIDHVDALDELHPNHQPDRCGGLITWAHRSAAKKWPFRSLPEVPAPAGHIQRKMVRIVVMADRILRLDRRQLMAGLGAAVLAPALPAMAASQGRPQ